MLQLILTYLFKPIERICTFTGTLTVQSVAQAYSLSLSLSFANVYKNYADDVANTCNIQ